MNYLAACEDNDCTTFEPLSDRVWFKISEDGFSHMESYKGEDGQDIRVRRFGSDALALEHDNSWTVKIPEGLRPGEYLLRHEFGEPIYFIFYELFWLIRASQWRFTWPTRLAGSNCKQACDSFHAPASHAELAVAIRAALSSESLEMADKCLQKTVSLRSSKHMCVQPIRSRLAMVIS